MSIANKLPWRIQTFLGFRPRKTNYDSIENVLKLSEERLPINAYKKVWDGYEVKMKDPSGFFNQKKHPYFKSGQVLEIEPVYFGSIKNGYYIQHNYVPCIMDSKLTILDCLQRHPYFHNPNKSSYSHSILSIKKLPSKKFFKGSNLSLCTNGSFNGYFHFLSRLATKIAVLEDLNINPNEFDHIFVNGPSKKYKTEILKQIGINLNKVVFIAENELIQSEYLFFVPRVRFHKKGHDFLRKKFTLTKLGKKNNLYISRADAKFRYLLNEEDLLDKLGNFEKICLSDHEVKEQASLFYNSNIIVGPHGAGFGNLLFCSKGTKIVEIYDNDFVNVNYWFYSNLLELEYYPILGNNVKGNIKNANRKGFDDIFLEMKLMNDITNEINKWSND